ncbi:MAG: YaiI/YqxD family protein [Proteobacteria bacterium]|nr:YaiI/YqxD family protein [Pseudomonadota bacterium]MBU1547845.1 YaiI/YqxD family protein [Pseudomonadota bacterium]MBU2619261.1 YaiI/YqxD family protein [Pseudomonadota bacterium]
MRIWIDADACPVPVKEILFRAADRMRVESVLVANHCLKVPRSPFIKTVQVKPGFNVADARIIDDVEPGDLVITADIPLAAEVVAASATALNPRGTLYTAESIQEHLARRNFMDEMRSAGAITGGPPALSKVHLQAFANQLDRYLTRYATVAPR